MHGGFLYLAGFVPTVVMTKMSCNKRMVKLDVVCPHHEMLLYNKKEWTFDILHVEGSQGY